MSINPHCVIFSFVFVSMWSIRVNVLVVSLVSDFIICLRPKLLKNYRYFFVSDDILFATFLMFSFSSPNINPNIKPFWYKFIFRSPGICHSWLNILIEIKLSDSISRNLVWAGGLQTIRTVSPTFYINSVKPDLNFLTF